MKNYLHLTSSRTHFCAGEVEGTPGYQIIIQFFQICFHPSRPYSHERHRAKKAANSILIVLQRRTEDSSRGAFGEQLYAGKKLKETPEVPYVPNH